MVLQAPRGAEAEWSDELAERRARGELNPQVGRRSQDEDAFEVVAAGRPGRRPDRRRPPSPAPDDVTLDDLE